MTELEILILLNKVDGVGPKTIRALKDHFPDLNAVFGASEDRLSSLLKIRRETVKNILKAPTSMDLSIELDFIKKENIEVISLWDSRYPSLLGEIFDPPPILYIKGHIPLKQPMMAIVGSRSSSHYGNQTAYRLAFQLASSGLAVVSGLARGIDTHAHRGTLAARGITVGVMGCGFRHFYPEENRPLADVILEKGCLISEFPSDTPPLSRNFPRRNRVISGLSLGVVIVEAARKSGSLITADFALEQGRSVFAVPGQIDSPTASGTLGLIKEGARLIQSVDDIWEELGMKVEAPKEARSEKVKPSLDPDEDTLLNKIGNTPVSVDEICYAVKMDASKVLSLLFNLELKHRVKQLPGKYYIQS